MTYIYLKQTISNEPRTPGDGSPVTQGQFSDKMPDAVLNTMLKTQGSGTPKPFAYITGGIDLSEFKQKKKYVVYLSNTLNTQHWQWLQIYLQMYNFSIQTKLDSGRIVRMLVIYLQNMQFSWLSKNQQPIRSLCCNVKALQIKCLWNMATHQHSRMCAAKHPS